MNYKQKYTDALDRASKLKVQNPFDTVGQMVEHIFPELEESEDERMSKEIIDFLRLPHHQFVGKRYHEKKWIAWLEKQGKKDPCIGCTNDKGCMTCENGNLKEIKPEPKFYPGDWVILNDTVAQIFDKQKYGFVGLDIDGKDFFCNYGHTNSMRLWSIEDANDGDVLINWNNTIFIFKAIEDGTVKFHIAYNENWDTIKTPSTKLSHLGLPEPQFEFHPATKEQRDMLFQKMKETGYEWDSEKKELKKIEPKILGADDILPYLGNNQVQDILEDMGMLDDNGQCSHTAEEIFKAGMEHAFNLNRENTSSVKLDADKVIEWLNENISFYTKHIVAKYVVVDNFKKDFGL